MRLKQRVLSLLLTACLVAGMLSTSVLAADYVSYIDADGNEQGTDADKIITAGSTTWNTEDESCWYYVPANGEIDLSGVTVTGDVYLMLGDGAILTVDGAISFEAAKLT